jgi:two-component system, chemotaxis family, protein-glutamate methylesterase/glutaminase
VPVQTPVRVAVCEDSRAFAFALRRFLERDGQMRVVGIYPSGEELLAALPELDVDLVTMDLELPGMDGVQATSALARASSVPVVVVSDHVRGARDRIAAAVAAGAVDAVPKSRFRLEEPDGVYARALRRRLRVLSAPGSSSGSGERVAERPAGGERRAGAIVIGASTGGPAALLTVLSGLPADFPIPVLVVQHISAGFTTGLAGWLDDQLALPVAVARPGSSLAPGVWLAPEGAHLAIGAARRLAVDRRTPPGAHCPSVDVLMRSAARALGPGAVGVVLTGMGRDGADGIAAVRDAGGLTIAQDAGSSVVYGMPRAAADRGAELILPLAEIPSALLALRAGVEAA